MDRHISKTYSDRSGSTNQQGWGLERTEREVNTQDFLEKQIKTLSAKHSIWYSSVCVYGLFQFCWFCAIFVDTVPNSFSFRHENSSV